MSDLAAKMSRQARKTPATPPTAAPSAADAGESWDDRNKRATFHLPVALLDTLQSVSDQTGRTKSALVREAIEHLVNDA